MVMEKIMKDGEYICKHCRLIYQVYGSRIRCDICSRKLKFVQPEELTELENKWDKQKQSNWRVIPIEKDAGGKNKTVWIKQLLYGE